MKIKIHQLSWWFCIFGHSPNTTGYTQVCLKTTCQSCKVLFATRKRVSWVGDTQLINFLVFFKLVCYVFFYCRSIFACCVNIISSAPKLSISICKFHISPPLEYHQTTFSLEIPHKPRNRELWWYAQQQMCVVWTYFSFHYLYIFPFT